ncbi:MAG: hypothetical protein SF097_25040 [Acidobacteriota bacterium]|nr:hypothetical protein [Acidobacteriota bacterium]
MIDAAEQLENLRVPPGKSEVVTTLVALFGNQNDEDRQEDASEAEAIMQAKLIILEKLLADSAAVAASINDLAALFENQEEDEEAD